MSSNFSPRTLEKLIIVWQLYKITLICSTILHPLLKLIEQYSHFGDEIDKVSVPSKVLVIKTEAVLIIYFFYNAIFFYFEFEFFPFF